MREIKYRFWAPSLQSMSYSMTMQEIARDLADLGDTTIPLQYTGLKDANGREIYEGDIYGKRGYWNYYIGWEDGAFVAIPCDPVQKVNWKWFRVTQESLEGFEVIGNIHENPELLEA